MIKRIIFWEIKNFLITTIVLFFQKKKEIYMYVLRRVESLWYFEHQIYVADAGGAPG